MATVLAWASLRLGKAHGEDRLELAWPAAPEPRRVAATRALESILRQGLESLPISSPELPTAAGMTHAKSCAARL